jgi:mRNA degradation ribonuclease J1/J2
MISIIDVGSSGNSNTFGSINNLQIDRDIYRRLQKVKAILIGYASEDSNTSITYFIEEMEKIQLGNKSNAIAVEVDNFFGSLGITQYYPHMDNTYTGELNG